MKYRYLAVDLQSMDTGAIYKPPLSWKGSYKCTLVLKGAGMVQRLCPELFIAPAGLTVNNPGA